MPSSSLILGVGAVLSTLSSTAFATVYQVQDSYTGANWLDAFKFETYDLNNGFVDYVSESTARSMGLYKTVGNDVMFGVDSSEDLSSADGGDKGRKSVRLEGRKDYNKGLFVIDVKAMPSVCGMWPAFWSLGREPWPVKGEIDIIEGVNKNTVNKYVLHTDTQCKVDGTGQSGTSLLKDCALDTNGASGCDVNDARTNSFGAGFNANQGGYYAMEWDSDAIRTWFFPRGSRIPTSLTRGEPDTSEFGLPAANFKGDCDIEKRFKDQRFIFTNNFCGDWAGNVYDQSGCPQYKDANGNPLSSMASCKKYVAENRNDFKDAFWRISSFKTYQKKAVSSSSSVARTSTRRSSSTVRSASSTPVRSSSVRSSSVHASSTPVRSSSVRSSSAHASSTPVRSSSVHASSSTIHSSSVHVSSSARVSSSVAHASSTPVRSSSSVHASASSSVHVSASSSVAHASSSVHISVSSDIASTSSYVHGSVSSSAVYPASSPHDSSIAYPSGASSDIVYPSGASSDVVYPTGASSDVVYPSGASSDVLYPASSSVPYYPDSTPVYPDTGYPASSPTPAYPVYDDSYPGYGSSAPGTPSTTPSVDSGYGNPAYPVYPESSAPSYPVYPESESSAPVYGDYPVYPSKSVHDDYDYLPEFTPVSPIYPDVTSKPSYGNDNGYDSYPEASKTTITTTYTTTYVDVCETGYTTITTTYAVTYCPTTTPAAYPTPGSDYPVYPPPGFEITTKVCDKGCGKGPQTVTVTVPCSKCNGYPTEETGKLTTPVPAYPTKPSYGNDDKDQVVTTKVYHTKVITLSKIAVPESEYYAQHPSSVVYGADKPSKPVETPAGGNPGKPVQPTGGYPATNGTLSHGTGYVKPSATKTAYGAPQFTGAASSFKAGGIVAVAAFAALLI